MKIRLAPDGRSFDPYVCIPIGDEDDPQESRTMGDYSARYNPQSVSRAAMQGSVRVIGGRLTLPYDHPPHSHSCNFHGTRKAFHTAAIVSTWTSATHLHPTTLRSSTPTLRWGGQSTHPLPAIVSQQGNRSETLSGQELDTPHNKYYLIDLQRATQRARAKFFG